MGDLCIYQVLIVLECLELSGIEDGNKQCLRHLSGLASFESLNLSFTIIKDGGLRNLAKLSSRSLNLVVRQINDAGLAAPTSMYTFTLSTLLDLIHLLMFQWVKFATKETTNGSRISKAIFFLNGLL